ncbi:protein LSM12-like [Mercenaria mercenaria]|uniref:protein LSM12-like n=1 Tax=Mercenaria mercenaria TaxID=6596 RepID=UPI001E1E11B3|nr:protein LSM12-like [Mercenaria mercenaria]
MKIMAENEYFSIGSIVSCTTCYQQKIQGEVMAFDLGTKMLAIKCQPSSGKHSVHDVKLVNLSYVSDVKVLKEADRDTSPPPLSNLNSQKINARLRQNIEDKKRQVNYIGVGVTPEGQKVFNAIVKTITDVKWDRQNIVVFEEVTIRPPYGLDDCKGKEGCRTLEHVKKIVQKHLKDLETQRTSDSRKSHSPSPAASS